MEMMNLKLRLKRTRSEIHKGMSILLHFLYIFTLKHLWFNNQ